MSESANRTCPARARTTPEIAWSSDVLPAPLAPSTAVMLPSSTASDTPATAVTGPWATTTSSSSSNNVRPAVLLRPQVRLEHLWIGLHLGRAALRDQLS